MALRTAHPRNNLHLRRTALGAIGLVLGGGALRAQVVGGDLDVPFITTPDTVVLAMLDLAGTSARDLVLDLGSGDGRIPIMAAARYGARGGGVDIDPGLVAQSIRHAQRAGVSDRVWFRQQDLFETDLSAAHVITLYLLPDVNLKLRPRLLALGPGTRIVSHDWDMGDWLPDREITVAAPNKPVGRSKQARLMLWIVPHDFSAVHTGTLTWAGVAREHAAKVRLVQRYQHVDGGSIQTDSGETWQVVEGRIRGSLLEVQLRKDNQMASAVGRPSPSGIELRAALAPRS